jgi:hypothetical protein
MARTTKVPVTMRALLQRLNRKLYHDGLVLRKRRGKPRTHSHWRLGKYYIVDLDHGIVVRAQVRPEAWGRKYGVLADFEEVRG